MFRFVLASVLLMSLSFPAPALAQDKKPPENVQKAQGALELHLANLGGPKGEILWKSEESLKSAFPEHTFLVARYRQFPVARVLPEGLRASNVFAIGKGDKILHVKDSKGLEQFFKSQQKKVEKDADAKQALAAWLTLAQEFHQDGMYRFDVLDKAFAVGPGKKGLEAAGRAIVMQGGNGELAVTLEFADGKLAGVTESAKIRPGPRPICQATKLLDADPIVRKIAEQDLLIMGLSAEPYLREQRVQANAELRQAIDRLWLLIERNGW